MTAHKTIAFRAATSGYQNGGTTATATVPSTVRAGDVILAFGAMADVTAGAFSLSSTAGSWTKLSASDVDDANLRTNTWWRVATSADADSTVTLSWTGSAKGGLLLQAYSGTHTTTPIQAVSGYATAVEAGTDTTHDAPGVTPAGPGYWVAEFVAARGAAALTITAPAGRTERVEQLGNSLGTVSQIGAGSAGTVTYDVATGAKTYTWDAALANAVGWSVALVPAPIDEPPTAPYDIRTELLLDGTWTTVDPGLVRYSDGISIRRGRAGEGGSADKGSCSLTLDNSSGDFFPRNPLGAYYGSLTRNTPLRVSLPYGSSYLHVPGDATDRATAPDSAGLSVTGDIDVRVSADMHWCEDLHLAGKWATTGNQRSWLLFLDVDGIVHWSWSTAGTSATATEVQSTTPLPVTAGPYGIRVTHDVNNGASGNTVTFYYSSDFSSWTQLGSAVVSSGTTSIFDSTASVEVGNVAEAAVSGTTTLWSQDRRILRAAIYNGIAGSLVASPRFEYQTAGASSFVDGQGNTWTMSGDSAMDDRDYRFAGEVPEWPPTADISGRDITVSIDAEGILRRLDRRDTPLRSAVYRGRLRQTTPPVAYWPMEDGEDADRLGSPIPGVNAMVFTGDPNLAGYSGFYGADSVCEPNGAVIRGYLPGYAGGNNQTVQALISVPTAGLADGTDVLWMAATGTAKDITITYNTTGGGTLGFIVYESTSPASVIASSTGIAGVNGVPTMVSLSITVSGGNVTFQLYGTPANSSTGAITSTASGTAVGYTLGRLTSVTINQTGGVTGSDAAVGHISVHNEALDLDDAPFRAGYAGESAGARILRLCAEEAISFRSIGTLGLVPSVPGGVALMGPQRQVSLMQLLRDAETADRGQLYEPTDGLTLGYRTRASLYSQAARVAVDYEAHELAAPLAPTDDDRWIRNDVTVTRPGGSSARAVVASGPLSIQEPPDGAGLYDHAEQVNVASDGDLLDQAGWLAHHGTIDQERHPSLSFQLASNELRTNLTLRDALRHHHLGDRVTVDNPPAWLPPDQLSQLSVGLTEFLTGLEHRLVLTTVPEVPYRAVALDDTTFGVLDTEGSTLAAGVASGATSLSVATPSGPLWSTSGDDFFIKVGGEVMTVTAVSGSSSPQTFTVTRSTNGVVKSHASGADVRLANQPILAL